MMLAANDVWGTVLFSGGREVTRITVPDLSKLMPTKKLVKNPMISV